MDILNLCFHLEKLTLNVMFKIAYTSNHISHCPSKVDVQQDSRAISAPHIKVAHLIDQLHEYAN